jgi:Zn-finger nucleic acid-binding protein
MMNCPRDHHELTSRLFEDFPVHKCLACFGFWVPKDVVIWLARAEHFTSLVQLFQADVFELSSLPQGTLACPADGTVMYLKSVRGVEMDICPACRGIWLDRGEFDTAAFRERTGWTEPQADSFLRLFLDTISYSSELSRELIRFIRDGLL